MNDDHAKEHHKRLIDSINSWGFQLLLIDGDGNCCFSALACSLLFQQAKILSADPTLNNLLYRP